MSSDMGVVIAEETLAAIVEGDEAAFVVQGVPGRDVLVGQLCTPL